MVTLVKWHKRELDNIRKEMDHVFNRCFQGLPGVGMRPGEWAPCLDLLESRDELVVRAELPGINPQELEITVHEGNLILRGERKIPTEEKNINYHRRERESGYFRRVLSLPAPVNPDKVEASYKDGILIVKLAKPEEIKPRQIKVKSA